MKLVLVDISGVMITEIEVSSRKEVNQLQLNTRDRDVYWITKEEFEEQRNKKT